MAVFFGENMELEGNLENRMNASEGNEGVDAAVEGLRRNMELLGYVIDGNKRDILAREVLNGLGVQMVPKQEGFEAFDDSYVARVSDGDVHLARLGDDHAFWRTAMIDFQRGEDDFYIYDLNKA